MSDQDITAALPTELLTMVLETQSHEDVMRMAQVSRRWRSAALSCDEFYIMLFLRSTTEASTFVPSRDISLCASRIAVSTPTPIQLHVNISTLPFDIPPPLQLLQQTRDLLVHAIPRIVDLTVYANHSNTLDSALSALVDHQAPRLRRLEVMPPNSTLQDIKLRSDILSAGAHRLHTLCLFSFDIPTELVPALSTIRRLELYRTPARIVNLICGDFPQLQYLHLENVTPVVAPSSYAGRVAVPGLQTLINFSSVDEHLKEIDFSGLRELIDVGTFEAAVLFARGPAVRRLELHVPYGEPHHLIDCLMGDAVAHLSITHASPSPQSGADIHRTITFGLAEHSELSALGDLSPFHSLARNLCLIDMAHINICEFICLESEFSQLETLRSSLHADFYDNDFYLTDLTAGRCPALQLLTIYSTGGTTDASNSSNWGIPEEELVIMCSEMGLFEREGVDQPRLLIKGLKIAYDEDGNEDALRVSGAFKSIIVEPN